MAINTYRPLGKLKPPNILGEKKMHLALLETKFYINIRKIKNLDS